MYVQLYYIYIMFFYEFNVNNKVKLNISIKNNIAFIKILRIPKLRRFSIKNSHEIITQDGCMLYLKEKPKN